MNVRGFESGASSDVKARLLRWFVFIALFVWLGLAIGLARFWILGLIFIATAAYASATVDPTLYAERLRPAGPTIDRDALRAIRLLAAAEIAIALLDIGRFHWSDTVPPAIQMPAMIFFAASMAIGVRAMGTNRFFSSAVRVQTDRGHRVVTGGPYGIIRHPGYLGMLVGAPAAALALGSWWAVIPAIGYSALIARRAAMEDRYLREQLDGYSEYAARVPYRLIPGIW